MKRSASQFVFVVVCGVLFLRLAGAQETTARDGTTTLRVTTNLVVVNAVALKRGTSAPDSTLERDDFTVFDDDRPVAIKTFDKAGATRPLAIWLLVQCSMQGWANEGSGIFAGHVSLFKPAFALLTPRDSVGVAHWCDDGTSRVDLAPTTHVDEALETLDQVLAPVITLRSHDRPGELALQGALQKIVDGTRSSSADRVPVVVFLYGDFSGMPKAEADGFVDALLKTSTTVYGLRDRRAPRVWEFPTEKGAIARYFADQTGGDYVTADPEGYAGAMRTIIDEVHSRYELSFTPAVLDGKRHSLKVTLTDTGKRRHKGTTIRYRSGYIAASEAQ
jgi:hypothetical protein